MTPHFITALLSSRIVLVLMRVLLTFVFWGAGLDKLINFPATVAEMAHFGLNPPAAFGALAVFTLLASSLLIIVNRAAWLGFGALGVFLVLTIPIAHPFWAAAGEDALHHFRTAVEHISLIGGLLAGAILSVRRTA
ncbi:MAG: DoxX family protein [Rhizobiales bacterium 12-68-15]|nr:MAG: DoxX family protein [Rhizobiales bacterium 12-68-15]